MLHANIDMASATFLPFLGSVLSVLFFATTGTLAPLPLCGRCDRILTDRSNGLRQNMGQSVSEGLRLGESSRACGQRWCLCNLHRSLTEDQDKKA